jgi:hypothetical protein
MKQMYNLRPYTVDFLVKPAKILYTLPSFHNIDGQIEEERLNGPQNNTKAEHAFSELCEQRGPPADLEEDFGESSFCGLANNSSPLMVSSDQISAGDKMESRMKDLNARLDSFILKYSSAKTANSTTKKGFQNFSIYNVY